MSRRRAPVRAGTTLCLAMDASARDEDRDRQVAQEQRSSGLLLGDLNAISARAADVGVESDAAAFDVGWTTDDLLA